MGRVLLALALFAFVVLGACDGVKSDPGADALLRLEGATFYRGAMPEDGAGPDVSAIRVTTAIVQANTVDKSCSGSAGRAATGVAIALQGDAGYWIVPTGAPSSDAPGSASFRTTLAFAPTLSSGQYLLVARAVDAEHRFGRAATQMLMTNDLVGRVDGGAPEHVRVTLTWDTEADLDLHVLDAAGNEVWKRDINSVPQPTPGEVRDPKAYADGGVLDIDSNAACAIDGRRKESVIYSGQAPPGHWVARVDTFSMCAAISAHWRVEARVYGVLVSAAAGTSYEVDTRFPHDRGAGVIALELDVP